MYTYKRTIKSGDMIEVEYYQSIRKIGKTTAEGNQIIL